MNLATLFDNEQFSDVTLVFDDGRHLRAHRLILAQIPYFQAMFKSGMKESKSGQIQLKDVDSTVACELIRQFYDHIFAPTNIRDPRLFDVADRWLVPHSPPPRRDPEYEARMMKALCGAVTGGLLGYMGDRLPDASSRLLAMQVVTEKLAEMFTAKRAKEEDEEVPEIVAPCGKSICPDSYLLPHSPPNPIYGLDTHCCTSPTPKYNSYLSDSSLPPPPK